MNNVFEKNIKALAQKDEVLASELSLYVPTDIPQLVKENNYFNLLYKNTYLHNKQNPLQEALEIFMSATNTPVTIHFIYGLGLGYLFQVASKQSQGTVILYEPDLNILKTAFSLVDFSEDISKNNIFITSDLKKAGEYIHKKSNTKNVPLLLSNIPYRQLNETNFNNLVQELQRMVGSYNMDLRYTKRRNYNLLKQMIGNIPKLVRETPLAEFKDAYKGKTAVVVSAGPTLDRNLETIKKYRSNIVLIVVGTAMKAIASADIIPDFLCIIETYDCSKQISNVKTLNEINFITDTFSSPEIRNINFKNIYTHISANQPINFFWKELTGIDISEYWSKGTVSYAALNCARILGCSKIVLVGQDLAYIDGQCYSNNSAYKDLQCSFNKQKNKWEITAKDFDSYCESLCNSPDKEYQIKVAEKRIRDLNNSLYYVKGINGDMIPTESVYAAFISPLEEFAEHFNNIEYINTSLVGAQINGYKNMPLEEALKDTSSIINRELNADFNYDISAIKNNINKNLTELKFAISKINEGESSLKALNNELKRTREINAGILKILKKVSFDYIELSTKFANKNKLFDIITTAERIDIEYEMKMTQTITVESINKLSESMSKYYSNAKKRIDEVSEMLKVVCEELG